MTNLPSVPPSDDGWGDAAAENAERVIRGALLKFSDWRWSKGKENEHVEDGTALVALDVAAGWVKWADGKPLEYRMRQPGRRLPERDELADLDESNWELDRNNEPKDPWQNTRFVYFVDPVSAEAYTYSTSTWGGRGAVADLADQIQRVRYANPGAVPVVELRSAPMLTKFGRKSKPFFKVIGWRGGGSSSDDNSPPLIESGAAREHTAAGKALDDEIPF
jgi:hypothetical protein